MIIGWATLASSARGRGRVVVFAEAEPEEMVAVAATGAS